MSGCWVRVESLDDQRRLVFGKVDNQPLSQTGIKPSRLLAFSYEKIRDHKTPRRLQEELALNSFRMRRTVEGEVTLHSHTLTTLHPFLRSWRETRRSRFRLLDIFSLQNATLLLDGRLQRGHPCQKQPSTNKAIFRSGQAKSGFPETFQCFR